MKILLIYTNRFRYLSPPPVGLTYLVNPLKEQGHEVRILDLMFSKNPLLDIETVIQEFKPSLAGFSIRNLDNQNMLDLKNPLPEIKEFVAAVKSKGIITVLGGRAFTTMPEEMLEYMGADYGIAGQGEESLPSLIRALEQEENLTDIVGLVYRNGSVVSMNPPVIKGYPGGIRADWSSFNIKPYKKNILTPAGAVVVKTGCPYQCIYCDDRIAQGNVPIYKSPDDIIEEILSIKKNQKIRNFFLIDTCFNSPLDKAKEILRRMIAADLKIRFMTRCNPVHDSFDDEFFALFKKAGGNFIDSGIDSFSDKMLENYHKPFRSEDIILFSQLAKKNGICFMAELLFGGPGETNETIKESMAFLPKVEYSMLTYSIGVRIAPRTPLFDAAVKEGLINDASKLLFAKFYVSKDIDVEWVKKYIDQKVKKTAIRFRKMVPVILRNILDALF